METKFKDVAHLYLGCDIVWKQYSGDYTDGTYGTDLYNSKLLREISLGNGKAIPILRPLSDMTEEEYQHTSVCVSIESNDYIREAENTLYLLSKHFDLFRLIESGQAIDAATLK